MSGGDGENSASQAYREKMSLVMFAPEVYLKSDSLAVRSGHR